MNASLSAYTTNEWFIWLASVVVYVAISEKLGLVRFQSGVLRRKLCHGFLFASVSYYARTATLVEANFWSVYRREFLNSTIISSFLMFAFMWDSIDAWDMKRKKKMDPGAFLVLVLISSQVFGGLVGLMGTFIPGFDFQFYASSYAMAIIGDASAALIGHGLGKRAHRFRNGRSVEGLVAFILIGGATALYFPHSHLGISFWGLGIFHALIESFAPNDMDDFLLISSNMIMTSLLSWWALTRV